MRARFVLLAMPVAAFLLPEPAGAGPVCASVTVRTEAASLPVSTECVDAPLLTHCRVEAVSAPPRAEVTATACVPF